MRLLVKIGGAQLERDDARGTLAQSLHTAREAGHEIVVVHGGGNQIRALSKRLGIEDRYHDGLRVTDADTAQVAVQVLAGEVNKALVASLGQHGVPAVGLCGADGLLFTARRHRPGGADLGYVGTVATVDRQLTDCLLAGGFVPTIATIAPLEASENPGEPLYNINADHGAGPLAAALGCDAALFLTDVPAVLDGNREPLRSLTAAQCDELREDGTIAGGMIPKVESALAALAALSTARPDAVVKIAPAAGPTAVLDALRDDIGTRFLSD